MVRREGLGMGIVKRAVAGVYQGASAIMELAGGVGSGIVDELLYGMLVAVSGGADHEGNGRFVPVRTCYGYQGFMKLEDLFVITEEEARVWEESDLMVVNGFCVDIMSMPKVQGVCLISLCRGALVLVDEVQSETDGWAKVRLFDGRSGYMQNQYLWQKQFSQAGVWEGGISQNLPPQNHRSERCFRQSVADTAYTYLGIQYRWGGKSTAGIDCSGLTSMSYLLNGVLIYRDAEIQAGYPVYEIPMERMKKGDLLYFPGHIAMYLGGGRYIHATGKAGSSGVVVNSLRPGDWDYREDLARGLYTVGSIFL